MNKELDLTFIITAFSVGSGLGAPRSTQYACLTTNSELNPRLVLVSLTVRPQDRILEIALNLPSTSLAFGLIRY